MDVVAPRQQIPDWLRAQPFRPYDHSMGRGRMDGADVVRMFHGVRAVAGSPGDWRDRPAIEALRIRCHALLQVITPGAFFGMFTAARIWGVPLPIKWLHDETIHTVVFAPDRAPNRPGVKGRQLTDDYAFCLLVSDLPIIDPLTMFCHLGIVLSLPDLVAVGDALIRIPDVRDPAARPPVELDLLKDRIGLYHGRGKRRAMEALELIRPGAESRPETLTRLLLANEGFPEPELNVELYDADGTFLARVDLLYRRYRVAVEYDGEQHRTNKAQYDRDVERLDDLAAHGWRVVRIGGRTLFGDPQDVVNRVRRALLGAGWRPDQ